MELKNSRQFLKIMAVISFLIGVVFRIILFLNLKLTIDENFTINLIGNDWEQFVDKLNNDAHPPLSYIIFYIINTISSNIVFLRIYPLILSILLPIISLKYIQKIFQNDEAGYIILIIISTSPNLIYLGSLLRMYCQFIFLSAISIFELLRTMKNIEITKNSFKIIIKNSIFFIIITTINIYTHYFAFFLLMIEFFALSISIILSPKNVGENSISYNLKYFFSYLIICIIPLIFFIPWLIFAWDTTSSLDVYFDFLMNTSISSILDNLINLESALWARSEFSSLIRLIEVILIIYLFLFSSYMLLKVGNRIEKTKRNHNTLDKLNILYLEFIIGMIIIIFLSILGSIYFNAHISRYFSFMSIIISALFSIIANIKLNLTKDKRKEMKLLSFPFISVILVWIILRTISFILFYFEYYPTNIILLN